MTKQTESKPEVVTVTVPLPVSLERIADLLCSAFEGGSNYWYRIERYRKPSSFPFRFRLSTKDEAPFPHLEYATNPGGAVFVADAYQAIEDGCEPDTRGGKPKAFPAKYIHEIDREALTRGLAIMANKYPRHFGDWIAERDDATTGDVFLQCIMFGEVKYG